MNLDKDFRALMPKLTKGCELTGYNEGKTAIITPHEQEGYAFVTVIEGGIAEGLKRGIICNQIENVLCHLKFDFDNVRWHTRHCTPAKENIWLCKNKSKARIYGNIEQSIEEDFCNWLKSIDVQFERQVKCEVGRADIVTKDCIYEVKDVLSNDSLYKAIGQLFLYRACLNPDAKLCIVYNFSDVECVHDYVKSIGIQLLLHIGDDK